MLCIPPHISTKTSKLSPIPFRETEIYSFEVFGTFQLSFAYQSATKSIPEWPHGWDKTLPSISMLQMKSLGHLGGNFRHFLQQGPVQSDHYFSFGSIYHMSNPVPIAKIMKLQWEPTLTFCTLPLGALKTCFLKSFTKCQNRLSLLLKSMKTLIDVQ